MLTSSPFTTHALPARHQSTHEIEELRGQLRALTSERARDLIEQAAPGAENRPSDEDRDKDKQDNEKKSKDADDGDSDDG